MSIRRFVNRIKPNQVRLGPVTANAMQQSVTPPYNHCVPSCHLRIPSNSTYLLNDAWRHEDYIKRIKCFAIRININQVHQRHVKLANTAQQSPASLQLRIDSAPQWCIVMQKEVARAT